MFHSFETLITMLGVLVFGGYQNGRKVCILMTFIQQTFDFLLCAERRRHRWIKQHPMPPCIGQLGPRSLSAAYKLIPVEPREEGGVRRRQHPSNASDRRHHLITYHESAKGRRSWLRGQHKQRQRQTKWCKVSVHMCVRQSKSVWLDDGRENKGQDLRLSA